MAAGEERLLDVIQEVVLEAWKALDWKVLCPLVESMPRRVEAVVQARGGYTKY